jgi:hypothetical protein
MQSGHCGIALSIKGGPGHGEKEEGQKKQRGNTERKGKRPTRSTSCELLGKD